MNFYLGIDEVGRGAIAGPVTVAGALIPSHLPKSCFHLESGQYTEFPENLKIVRDSKKLTPKKRQVVVDTIKSEKFPSLILSASNQLIDSFGIATCINTLATIISNELFQDGTEILLDGSLKLFTSLDPVLLKRILIENNIQTPGIKRLDYQTHKFGDDTYLAIALASNLAKVYRDDLMTELAEQNPQYGWQKNKGYATKSHREAILTNSKNEYLRYTFLTKILDKESQLKLF